MMGIKNRQFSTLPDLSLEDLVPNDHLYRRLEAELELSFVRELVAPLYAGGGRPSVDPVVFFKLHLEPLPDHSSLTRIRERYGLEIFRSFFDRIVEMCVEAGLVWGKELFVDSTTVRANAAKGSLVPRFAVEKHLDGLFEEEESVDAVEAAEMMADAVLPAANDPELKEANAAVRDFVSSAGRHGEPSRNPSPRIKWSDHLVSRTDPDARLSGHLKTSSRMSYKAHYVVDGGKARIVLSALVTRADLQDNQPMLDLLWHTNFRWKIRPHHITGDSVYGTLPNVKAVEQAGIRAYMPIIDYTRGKRLFRKDEFVYDPERDIYRCPAGKILKKDGIRFKQRITRYIADPKTCNSCPLKSKCTDGKSGRAVARSFDEEYYDRVREYQKTEPYQKALRKRKVWIEPLFGEAKQWHRMERLRLRMLERVNCEVLIVTSGQNIKRLLTFGRRGPRSLAQAAALRPPERPLLYLDHRKHRVRRQSFTQHRGVFQQAARNSVR